MAHYTITVTEVTAGRPRRQVAVEASDPQAAITRGIVRLFGAHTFWHRDAGRPGYGQVLRNNSRSPYVTSAGADGVTVLARLEVHEIAEAQITEGNNHGHR
jgi:hypothetical protein